MRRRSGVLPVRRWPIRYGTAASSIAASCIWRWGAKEIFAGRGGNSFAPKETATRAEVAAILQRFLRRSFKLNAMRRPCSP
ncbi:S-layer homology domain-containing protein [Cohnella ginsengisoli]|uniref:S-layer homology domain-containing protein n=1 Tax=Cohnella ginsengisoli TaxID=425004 RepID=UPI003B8A79B6